MVRENITTNSSSYNGIFSLNRNKKQLSNTNNNTNNTNNNEDNDNPFKSQSKSINQNQLESDSNSNAVDSIKKEKRKRFSISLNNNSNTNSTNVNKNNSSLIENDNDNELIKKEKHEASVKLGNIMKSNIKTTKHDDNKNNESLKDEEISDSKNDIKQRSFTKRYSSPIFGLSFGQKNHNNNDSYTDMHKSINNNNNNNDTIVNEKANDTNIVNKDHDLSIKTNRKKTLSGIFNFSKTSPLKYSPTVLNNKDATSNKEDIEIHIKESSKNDVNKLDNSNNNNNKLQSNTNIDYLPVDYPQGFNRNKHRPSSDKKTFLQIELENKLKSKIENSLHNLNYESNNNKDLLINSNSNIETSERKTFQDVLDQGTPELYKSKHHNNSNPNNNNNNNNNNSNSNQNIGKPSLMLQTAFQDKDILSEFLELQKGVGYYAKPLSTTQTLLGSNEDLYIRINLLGIHISKEEVSQPLVEFAIEHVMTFSHNRTKKTFTFSYLHSDGLLNEYKFQSDKYFEIFESLGSAISIVISMKEKQNNEESVGKRIVAESMMSGLNQVNTSDNSTPALSRKLTKHYNDDGTNLELPDNNLPLQQQLLLEEAIQEQQQYKNSSQQRERRKSLMPSAFSSLNNSKSNSLRSSQTANINSNNSLKDVEQKIYKRQIGDDYESKIAYQSLTKSSPLSKQLSSEIYDNNEIENENNLASNIAIHSSSIKSLANNKNDEHGNNNIDIDEADENEIKEEYISPVKKDRKRSTFKGIFSIKQKSFNHNDDNNIMEDIQNSDSNNNKIKNSESQNSLSTANDDTEISVTTNLDGINKDNSTSTNANNNNKSVRKASFAKFYLETRFKSNKKESQKSIDDNNTINSAPVVNKTSEDGSLDNKKWKNTKRFDYIQINEENKKLESSNSNITNNSNSNGPNSADPVKKRNRLSIFRNSKTNNNSDLVTSPNNTSANNVSYQFPSNNNDNEIPTSPDLFGDPNCVMLSPADTLASPIIQQNDINSPLGNNLDKNNNLNDNNLTTPVNNNGSPIKQKNTWLRKTSKANIKSDIKQLLNQPPTMSPPPIPKNKSDNNIKENSTTNLDNDDNNNQDKTSSRVNVAELNAEQLDSSEKGPYSAVESQASSPFNDTFDENNGNVNINNKYGTLRKMKSGFNTMMKGKKRQPINKVYQGGEAVDVNNNNQDANNNNNSIINHIPHGPIIQKIYDEENNEILITVDKGQGDNIDITAGTVDALISSLCGVPNLAYVEVFLLTFRHFTTPEMLMNKLTKMYDEAEIASKLEKNGEKPTIKGSPLSSPGTEPALLICHRIVSLVKKWVGEHTYDFLEPKTMEVLNTFLELVASGEYRNYADQIKRILTNELENLDIRKTDLLLAFSSLEKDQTISLLNNIDLLNISAKKLAQQITIVDSKLFRGIKTEEFAVMLWGGGTKDIRAQRLQAYIDRFNTIGYWTASAICSEENKQRRVAVMEKFVRIACRCFEIQNFNSSMAILSGLNTTPVLRLSKTKAMMSSRIESMLTDLESKLSYKSNYKVYREIEHLAKPPLLPFFGLIIKDLTFMNDGNPKCLPNGLINFEKQRLVCNYINHVREFQRYVFPFQPEEEPLRVIQKQHHHNNNNINNDLPNSSTKSLNHGEKDNSNNNTSNSNQHHTIGAGQTNLYIYCCRPPCLLEEEIMELSMKCETSQLQQNRNLLSSTMAVNSSIPSPTTTTTTPTTGSANNSLSRPSSEPSKNKLVTSISEPLLENIEDDNNNNSNKNCSEKSSIKNKNGSSKSLINTTSSKDLHLKSESVPITNSKSHSKLRFENTSNMSNNSVNIYDDDKDDIIQDNHIDVNINNNEQGEEEIENRINDNNESESEV